MAVNPMLSTGAAGINQGRKNLDSVAQEVAGFSVGAGAGANAGQNGGLEGASSQGSPGVAPTGEARDSAQALVDLRLYQRQVQASAKVVETADQVIGFLLDVRA